MLNTILYWLFMVAKAFTVVGLAVSLSMTIYAMKTDGLTGFGGLVFCVTMFFSWPVIVYEAIADEVRYWWQEHIDTTGASWRERY